MRLHHCSGWLHAGGVVVVETGGCVVPTVSVCLTTIAAYIRVDVSRLLSSV